MCSTNSRLLATCLLASFASAQNASYDSFGAGCPGTGTGLGAGHVAPQAFAATFMPSNNAMGFYGTSQRYQQVFVGTEFPTAFVMNGVALRWDNQVYQQIPGALVDLEISVGYTTKTPATITNDFAANFDLGAPVNVLPRTNVALPDQNNPPALDPTQFQALIAWPNTFAWTPQPGRNLLIEFVMRGSSLGSAFVYVFDCGWSASTARVYGSATSATGSLDGFAYGYVMKFLDRTNTAVPVLTGTDTPQFGNNVPIVLTQAKANTFALLLTGFSDSWWNGFALPLPLAPFGAPGCSMLASWDLGDMAVTNAAGRCTVQLQVPVDFGLLGLHFYNQYAAYDPAANAFGYALTNGGAGVIGN